MNRWRNDVISLALWGEAKTHLGAEGGGEGRGRWGVFVKCLLSPTLPRCDWWVILRGVGGPGDSERGGVWDLNVVQ